MKRWMFLTAAAILVLPLAIAHADDAQKGMGRHHGGPGFGPGAGHRMAFRGDGEMPSMVEHLAKRLDLTEDQKTSALALEAKMKASMEPIHADLMRVHEQLDQALESNAPAATVGALAIEGHQLREKAEAARTDFQTQLQELLTAEQREKLAALHTEMRSGPHGRRGHHGRHGEMPPADEE